MKNQSVGYEFLVFKILSKSARSLTLDEIYDRVLLRLNQTQIVSEASIKKGISRALVRLDAINFSDQIIMDDKKRFSSKFLSCDLLASENCSDDCRVTDSSVYSEDSANEQIYEYDVFSEINYNKLIHDKVIDVSCTYNCLTNVALCDQAERCMEYLFMSVLVNQFISLSTEQPEKFIPVLFFKNKEWKLCVKVRTKDSAEYVHTFKSLVESMNKKPNVSISSHVISNNKEYVHERKRSRF